MLRIPSSVCWCRRSPQFSSFCFLLFLICHLSVTSKPCPNYFNYRKLTFNESPKNKYVWICECKIRAIDAWQMDHKDLTVVPQRDAISRKSPVSRLQVLPQILHCSPSSFWSVATNFHPEFFGRTGTVKRQWDTELELSAGEIQCNPQKLTCTTGPYLLGNVAWSDCQTTGGNF
jgi:hypothetical protein